MALFGNYFQFPNNWDRTLIHIGDGSDWPGKFRRNLPGFPFVDLVADYVGLGTVIYWIEPNVLSVFGALPFLVPNKRLVKPPNWIPGKLVPQPANAFTVFEACGYSLITIGGAIIVVTIIEDIASVGGGTFDDIITIPAGYLLINLGQRTGVIIPNAIP